MVKRLWIALCLVLLLAGVAWGSSHCKKTIINAQGTAGAAVTVSTSAVTVAAANPTRCSLLIDNVSTNPMRCRAAGDGDPTTTVGKLIDAGETLSLGVEGQELWKCIRTGASDATAEVAEGLPTPTIP